MNKNCLFWMIGCCLFISTTTTSRAFSRGLQRHHYSKSRWWKSSSISSNLRMMSTVMYHLEEVESTQEEAKRLLKEQTTENKRSCWGVTAMHQSKGRGTSGREWKNGSGNCFLSIVVPCSRIDTKDFKLSLLPLYVGTIVANTLTTQLEELAPNNTRLVSVKWPNDVLLEQKKVAGILIEYHDSHYIVGIGVNVQSAPLIDPTSGRPSTCLMDYITPSTTKDQINHSYGNDLSKTLATQITQEIDDTISNLTSEDVLQTWSTYAHQGNFFIQPSFLRDISSSTGNKKCHVQPLSIQPDGQLLVQDLETQQTRILCTDYLF